MLNNGDLWLTGIVQNHFVFFLGSFIAITYFAALLLAYSNRRTSPAVIPLSTPRENDSLIEYIVSVYTSAWPGSRCPASTNVYLNIQGVYHETGSVLLKKQKSSRQIFTRGSLDIFILTTKEQLGTLKFLKLELKNSSDVTSQWKPFKFEIFNFDTKEHWIADEIPSLKCKKNLTEKLKLSKNACPVERWKKIVSNFLDYHYWFYNLSHPESYGIFSNTVRTLLTFFTETSFLFSNILCYIVYHEPYDEYRLTSSNYLGFLISFISCSIVILGLEFLLRSIRPTFQREFRGLPNGYDRIDTDELKDVDIFWEGSDVCSDDSEMQIAGPIKDIQRLKRQEKAREVFNEKHLRKMLGHQEKVSMSRRSARRKWILQDNLMYREAQAKKDKINKRNAQMKKQKADFENEKSLKADSPRKSALKLHSPRPSNPDQKLTVRFAPDNMNKSNFTSDTHCDLIVDDFIQSNEGNSLDIHPSDIKKLWFEGRQTQKPLPGEHIRIYHSPCEVWETNSSRTSLLTTDSVQSSSYTSYDREQLSSPETDLNFSSSNDPNPKMKFLNSTKRFASRAWNQISGTDLKKWWFEGRKSTEPAPGEKMHIYKEYTEEWDTKSARSSLSSFSSVYDQGLIDALGPFDDDPGTKTSSSILYASKSESDTSIQMTRGKDYRCSSSEDQHRQQDTQTHDLHHRRLDSSILETMEAGQLAFDVFQNFHRLKDDRTLNVPMKHSSNGFNGNNSRHRKRPFKQKAKSRVCLKAPVVIDENLADSSLSRLALQFSKNAALENEQTVSSSSEVDRPDEPTRYIYNPRKKSFFDILSPAEVKTNAIEIQERTTNSIKILPSDISTVIRFGKTLKAKQHPSESCKKTPAESCKTSSQPKNKKYDDSDINRDNSTKAKTVELMVKPKLVTDFLNYKVPSHLVEEYKSKVTAETLKTSERVKTPHEIQGFKQNYPHDNNRLQINELERIPEEGSANAREIPNKDDIEVYKERNSAENQSRFSSEADEKEAKRQEKGDSKNDDTHHKTPANDSDSDYKIVTRVKTVPKKREGFEGHGKRNERNKDSLGTENGQKYFDETYEGDSNFHIVSKYTLRAKPHSSNWQDFETCNEETMESGSEVGFGGRRLIIGTEESFDYDYSKRNTTTMRPSMYVEDLNEATDLEGRFYFERIRDSCQSLDKTGLGSSKESVATELRSRWLTVGNRGGFKSSDEEEVVTETDDENGYRERRLVIGTEDSFGSTDEQVSEDEEPQYLEEVSVDEESLYENVTEYEVMKNTATLDYVSETGSYEGSYSEEIHDQITNYFQTRTEMPDLPGTSSMISHELVESLKDYKGESNTVSSFSSSVVTVRENHYEGDERLSRLGQLAEAVSSRIPLKSRSVSTVTSSWSIGGSSKTTRSWSHEDASVEYNSASKTSSYTEGSWYLPNLSDDTPSIEYDPYLYRTLYPDYLSKASSINSSIGCRFAWLLHLKDPNPLLTLDSFIPYLLQILFLDIDSLMTDNRKWRHLFNKTKTWCLLICRNLWSEVQEYFSDEEFIIKQDIRCKRYKAQQPKRLYSDPVMNSLFERLRDTITVLPIEKGDPDGWSDVFDNGGLLLGNSIDVKCSCGRSACKQLQRIYFQLVVVSSSILSEIVLNLFRLISQSEKISQDALSDLCALIKKQMYEAAYDLASVVIEPDLLQNYKDQWKFRVDPGYKIIASIVVHKSLRQAATIYDYEWNLGRVAYTVCKESTEAALQDIYQEAYENLVIFNICQDAIKAASEEVIMDFLDPIFIFTQHAIKQKIIHVTKQLVRYEHPMAYIEESVKLLASSWRLEGLNISERIQTRLVQALINKQFQKHEVESRVFSNLAQLKELEHKVYQAVKASIAIATNHLLITVTKGDPVREESILNLFSKYVEITDKIDKGKKKGKKSKQKSNDQKYDFQSLKLNINHSAVDISGLSDAVDVITPSTFNKSPGFPDQRPGPIARDQQDQQKQGIENNKRPLFRYRPDILAEEINLNLDVAVSTVYHYVTEKSSALFDEYVLDLVISSEVDTAMSNAQNSLIQENFKKTPQVTRSLNLDLEQEPSDLYMKLKGLQVVNDVMMEAEMTLIEDTIGDPFSLDPEELAAIRRDMGPLREYAHLIEQDVLRRNKEELRKQLKKYDKKHNDYVTINLQNLTDSYSVANSNPDFKERDLYLLEWYITGELQKPLSPAFKVPVLILMFLFTIFCIIFISIKGAELTIIQCQEWISLYLLTTFFFAFILTPVKALVIERFRPTERNLTLEWH